MKLKSILIMALILPTFLFSQVYVLKVEGTIDMGLAHFFERAIPEKNAEGGKAIILDIDTFGGRVDAATMMRDALLESDMTTIAFINSRAISAGSLISLACDTIVMRTGATMGATTVVDGESNKASEKSQSYMREEMATTAEANGRNGNIAMAMVDETLDIDTLVLNNGDTLFIDDVEGAKSGKLVTLRTSTAMKYNMVDYEIDSFDAMLEHFGFENEDIVYVTPTWSEKVVRFLTNPVVSSLLMALGFLGLIFEVQSPGWGVGGTVAIIALGLFFSTSIIADLASMNEVLIFLVGVILLALEAFVIPGFGVTGIAGTIVVIYGLFLMLLPETPTSLDMESALVGVTIAFIGGIIGSIYFIKNMSKTRFWKKVALGIEETRDEGYSSDIGLSHLVSTTGVAISDLRPAGTANFSGKRIDVLTDGEYIEKESEIRVIKVEGNRIFVEKS